MISTVSLVNIHNLIVTKKNFFPCACCFLMRLIKGAYSLIFLEYLS